MNDLRELNPMLLQDGSELLHQCGDRSLGTRRYLKSLTTNVWNFGSEDYGAGNIVDMDEISRLVSVAEDFPGRSHEGLINEFCDDTAFVAGKRSIAVAEPKADRFDAKAVLVCRTIRLAGELACPIGRYWVGRDLLVKWRLAFADRRATGGKNKSANAIMTASLEAIQCPDYVIQAIAARIQYRRSDSRVGRKVNEDIHAGGCILRELLVENIANDKLNPFHVAVRRPRDRSLQEGVNYCEALTRSDRQIIHDADRVVGAMKQLANKVTTYKAASAGNQPSRHLRPPYARHYSFHDDTVAVPSYAVEHFGKHFVGHRVRLQSKID